MNLGNVARVVAVLGAVVAAVGSASSNQNGASQSPSYANGSPYNSASYSPPPPQQMEPARALGLWRSTFGAVKIEADQSRGGIEGGALQGIWVYQRQGQEVIGYFSGQLRGNVLEFKWQEPNNPPLTGEGYLVFDRSGRQYSGRWWSERRDRVGDWNGWRNAPGAPANNPYDPQRGGDRYNDPSTGELGGYPNPDDDRAPRQPGGALGPDPYQRQPAPQPGYGPQPRPQPPQPPPPTYY